MSDYLSPLLQCLFAPLTPKTIMFTKSSQSKAVAVDKSHTYNACKVYYTLEMDVREFVKDPNKLGTFLGCTIGGLAVGLVIAHAAAAPPAEVPPPQPAPVSEACVDAPNPDWCEIQELFSDWSQE